MIDIHTHILPEIDDGAENIEESREMAREAVRAGITHVVASPHHGNGIYVNERDDVIRYVLDLQKHIDEFQIPLTIIPGQEIHLNANFMEDIENERVLTINRTGKYVLLELPHHDVPNNLDHILYELQLRKIIPIIPHPERNRAIREKPELLYRMVKRGALVQLTAGSILGTVGTRIQRFSHQCIRHDLCHFIASDAHHPVKRGFNLHTAYEYVAKHFGSDLIEMYQQNAQCVVDGTHMYVDPPQKIQHRRTLLSMFRR